MATSTLVQFLSSGEAGDTSNRSQTETFLARQVWPSGDPDPGTLTINAGDWVQFDSRATVTGADRALFVRPGVATGLGAPVIGVAMESISLDPLEGQTLEAQVKVTVAGYVASANVVTGVAADAPLSVDTTDGRAHAADAANAVICGVCLETAASNTAPVIVFKQF